MSDPKDFVSEEELNKIVEHLRSDEQASLESTLDSVESFQSWINSHPAMRQMFVVDKLSDVLPAIWKFLRVMFGFDGAAPEDHSTRSADEDDR